jgi:uncharacterized repeat protein (TIGR01451 family)
MRKSVARSRRRRLTSKGPDFDVNGGHGLVMADASVRSVLTPLVVTMTFSPPSIAPGGTSTLTITLKNNNAVALQGVGFTDTYSGKSCQRREPERATDRRWLHRQPYRGRWQVARLRCRARRSGWGDMHGNRRRHQPIGNSFVNSTGSITTPMQLNSSGAMATLSTCTYALAPTDLSNRPAAGGVSNIIVTTLPAVRCRQSRISPG